MTMWSKYTIIGLLVSCFFSSQGQNLVPNPSFEDYEFLPGLMCQSGLDFERAIKHWIVPNEASTDLINPRTRSKNLSTCVPRSGKNMAGIVTNGDFWTEYVGVRLKDSLVVGTEYYVEFWVSMPSFYSKKKPVAMALNDYFGVWFGKRQYHYNKRILTGKPQVPATASSFVEPEKWTKVHGTFVAEEPHTYLYLGQFFEQNMDSEMAIGYLFIDDVYVEAFSSQAVDFEPSRYYKIDGGIASIMMENIYFETDRHELLSESYVELDKLVNILNKNPGLKLNIQGHTDSEGSADHNQSLSERRAKSVVEYLIIEGISDTRLVATGHGYSKPVADNTSEKGKQQNRRVEFVVSGSSKSKTVFGPESVYQFNQPGNSAEAISARLRSGKYDPAWNCDQVPDQPSTKQKRAFKMAKRAKAKTKIIEALKDQQVVCLDYNTFAPQTIAYATTLLQDFFDAGYTYLTIESLSYDDNQLQKRGYPVLTSSEDFQLPIFGSLIREAIQMGFEIFPFDAKGDELEKAINILRRQNIISNPNDPLARKQAQQWAQAMNISRIFKRNPDAKVLVLNRSFTNQEYSDNGIKYMAAWFKQFTRIDPLTINQTLMTEGCRGSEHELYKNNQLKEPAVYTLNQQVFVDGNKAEQTYFDLQIFHPRTEWINGRPNWMQANLNRKFYKFNPDKHNVNYPCIVMAYPSGEEVEFAVPVDVVEILAGKKDQGLLLPSGDYTLVARDNGGSKKIDISVE